MGFRQFDARPVIVAIAGPNGAGKTTFYHTHVEAAGLRFINADVLAHEVELDPYAAARYQAEAFEPREDFVAPSFDEAMNDLSMFVTNMGTSSSLLVLGTVYFLQVSEVLRHVQSTLIKQHF